MGKQLFSNERKKLAILLVVFFSIFVLSVASAAPIQSSSPKAPYAYITNDGSNNVSVIDTSTKKVTETIDVGFCPAGVAVTPDGTKVYVTNSGDDNISVI